MANELLTVEQMYSADRLAIENGVSGLSLMEAAGMGIERVVRKNYAPCRVAVLCGPGNNGGDGFVVARLLQNRGWSVKLSLLGSRESLKGDAEVNAQKWRGRIHPFGLSSIEKVDLVIDAVFGAGLARPVEGQVAEVFNALNQQAIPVVAVDVPSGVDGNTGEIAGIAPYAAQTVTFFRAKPGHYLLPGKIHVGDLTVCDIGTPEQVWTHIKPRAALNNPRLWDHCFPHVTKASHKYSRGHAVVYGGPMTGAARMAALAARRTGAGLLSILCHQDLVDLYATAEPGNIVTGFSNATDLAIHMEDKRKNVILVGPGAGVSEETRSYVQTALRGKQVAVLDADALSSFESLPDELFSNIEGRCLLTPHEGEFSRLFDIDGGKVDRAREAAKISKAVVLLKGNDTVIAASDGRVAINGNAPPSLATGGSGDVLAGIAAGLLAQGMPVFEAACAAAWLHGKAAELTGCGLIAEDLAERLPATIKLLKEIR